jgi:hypothetical protein
MVLVNMADIAPAQAANVVLTAANAATSPRLALLILAAEPGLNPYHPNHKQKVPRNCTPRRKKRMKTERKMNMLVSE